MSKSTSEMGKRHAAHVNELLGMRESPGSGNRFWRPTDGRHEPGRTFRCAQDSKSTLARSMSISLAMLDKLVEQAHGLIPLLPMRFYRADNLSRYDDWVLLRLEDFHELWEAAENFYAAQRGDS